MAQIPTSPPSSTASPSLSASSKKWGGKVLLAGEYTVTCGGAALAVCLGGLGGCWQMRASGQERDLAWAKFGTWILGQDWPWFNQAKWKTEFKHLAWVSDLPQGIGLGSSGALCAAIYDRFALDDEVNILDDALLKARLACLEGYFHGVSSGLDPLVCLRQKAYLVQDKLQSIALPRPWHLQKLASLSALSAAVPNFFLWDCGIPRQTKNLMPHFQKLGQSDPAAVEELKLAQQNLALALANHLKGEPAYQDIFSSWHMVANLEAKYLAPMIPPIVQKFWPGENFQLKLCGAGGGGCFLGLAAPGADLRPLLAIGPVWQLVP